VCGYFRGGVRLFLQRYAVIFATGAVLLYQTQVFFSLKVFSKVFSFFSFDFFGQTSTKALFHPLLLYSHPRRQLLQ